MAIDTHWDDVEAFNPHLRSALSMTLLNLDPSLQIQGQMGEESPLQSPLLLWVSSFLCLPSTVWRGEIESKLRTGQTLHIMRPVVSFLCMHGLHPYFPKDDPRSELLLCHIAVVSYKML